MTKDCVSLEVAQKLQKAGYKQTEGYFYDPPFPFVVKTTSPAKEYIPAPTATQLAEELPCFVVDKGGEHYLTMSKQRDEWEVCYDREDSERVLHLEMTTTLTDALGLMMVYLLENNLITND